MHRAAAVVTPLVLLLTLSLHAATAHQATPVAAGATGPDVGTTVVVLGNDETEIAAVTVTDLTDPFADYEPDAPPERGFHFVLLTVTIANTGIRALGADPNDVSLVGSDGFRYSQRFLRRGNDPTPPDFDRQDELASGAEVSGAIGFEVLDGVEVAQVVYTPSSDRLIILVDHRVDSPVLGTGVSFSGAEGAEIGKITVAGVVDPFVDYAPDDPPLHGYHYVLVTATIANTGSQPLAADPNDLFIVDADGFLAGADNVRRADNATPPDFDRQDALAPGAEATGGIFYQLLNGTAPASIVYAPAGDRLITAAVFGELAGPRPTPRPGDATVTPTAAAEPTTTAVADCDAIVAWYNPTYDRVTRLTTIFDGLPPLDAATVADVPALRQAAADVAALAEEQRTSQPPPEAQAFNDVIVDYFTNLGMALDFFADGIEQDDPATRMVALANMGEYQQTFQTDGTSLFNELVGLCPG